MSYRRERIDKAIDTALACQGRMASATRYDAISEELTGGIAGARKAIELLNSYCRKEGKDDLMAEFHKRRTGDRLASYAWEMRNAEEHDVDGAVTVRDSVLRGSPIDPLRPIFIKSLVISRGRVLVDNSENLRHEITLGGVDIGPIAERNGREIEKPAGATPETLLKALIDVAVSYRNEVQPR